MCIVVIGLNKQHFKDNIYSLLETILDEINSEYKILNVDEILRQLKDNLDQIYDEIIDEMKEHDKSIVNYNNTDEIDEIFLFSCNDSDDGAIISNKLYRCIMKQNIMFAADFSNKQTRKNFEQYVFDVICETIYNNNEIYVKFKLTY